MNRLNRYRKLVLFLAAVVLMTAALLTPARRAEACAHYTTHIVYYYDAALTQYAGNCTIYCACVSECYGDMTQYSTTTTYPFC